jgi:hypothetical protein
LLPSRNQYSIKGARPYNDLVSKATTKVIIAASIATAVTIMGMTFIFSMNKQDSILQVTAPLDNEDLALYSKSKNLPVVQAFLERNPHTKAYFDYDPAKLAYWPQLGFYPKAVIVYSVQGNLPDTRGCEVQLLVVADMKGNVYPAGFNFYGPVSEAGIPPTVEYAKNTQCIA